MAAISESTRRFVDGKLAEAAGQIEAERRHQPPAPMDFDRALERYCSGTTKACVSSAIHLIDRAIQGESF